jgi:hypothetical protein
MSDIARRSDRLFNDIYLPQETIRIRERIRAFAQDVLAPVAYRLNTTPESRDSFPMDNPACHD